MARKAVCNVKGVIAAVFTPFHESGALNLSLIPEYARYLSSNKVDGILVGGSTGEATSLSIDERKKVLEAWMAETKPLGLTVVVGIGGAPLPHVLELAKHAEDVKVDALFTLPELYFKPKTAEQLVEYLQDVSDAAPTLPLIYYNSPLAPVDVSVAELIKLASARIPNFAGMKTDVVIANQVAHLLRPDQKIFISNHVQAPAHLLGHSTSMATVNTMFPKLVQDVAAAVAANDMAKAKQLQEKLNAIVAAIGSQDGRESVFVPSFKAAMALVTGLPVGNPRKPLKPIGEAKTALVKEQLIKLGVELKQ